MIKILVIIIVLLQSSGICADERSEAFSQIVKVIKEEHSTNIMNDDNFIERRSDKFEIKVSGNSISIGYLLKKAKTAFDMGRIDVAESFYKQILDKFPENKSALIGLGNIYYIQNDYKKAHEIYLVLLKKYPKDINVALNYLTVVSDYDPELALKKMLNLSSDANSAPLHASIGLLYLKLNELDSAKNCIISALSLEQENIYYIYNLAIIFDKLSDFKNASFFYQKLINLQDKDIIKDIPIEQINNRLKFINSRL